jgi:hypothetical protein
LKAAGALDAEAGAASIQEDALEMLAAEAARQWTGTFNPRPFDATGALSLYRRAFQIQPQNA